MKHNNTLDSLLRNTYFVFDLDGVLVNSQEIGRQAVNLALATLGCSYTISRMEWYSVFIMQGGSSGLNSKSFLKNVLDTDDLIDFHSARDRAWVSIIASQGIEIYRDALALCRYCSKFAKGIGIVTNNDRSVLEIVLAYTPYGKLFGSFYISARDLGLQKPDPQIIHALLDKFAINGIQKLVIIGDTMPDYELARRFEKTVDYGVLPIIRIDPFLRRSGFDSDIASSLKNAFVVKHLKSETITHLLLSNGTIQTQ